MSSYLDAAQVFAALVLVAVNGFFVAAEFALVKVRGSQVTELERQGRTFASTAVWLVERLEGALGACQLGITMASLALGWVGEPAFSRLLEPLFHHAGVTSATAVHTISFLISFTVVSSLHLVIGEQAPKIFAIRRPEQVLLWCALPMKWFYLASYPLMVALNGSTSIVLGWLGMEGGAEHDSPHSEDEIRALLREAHIHGNLTRSEHRLLDAVFEFDDMVVRRVMVPRSDVEFIDIDAPVSEGLSLAARTRHTRYPLCRHSLDELMGVVHVKDLIGAELDEGFDWTRIMRPPRKVPETLPISKVLRHFQATHQLMAFVVDEYGTVIGIVTLENVLEQIVGPVDDEFDVGEPEVVPDGPGRWIVRGTCPVEILVRSFDLDLEGVEADTLSGLLVHHAERLLDPGDEIALGEYRAEVLEVRSDRAHLVRLLNPEAVQAATPGEATSG